MESLALRLLLPPLVVTVASLGQRHLGDRLGGLLVGLPLTSGTFLGLLLHAHGPSTVAGAAAGVLAGQVAVVAMALAYARLARAGIVSALVGCLVCWALVVMAMRPVDGLVACSVLFAAAALAALNAWPVSNAPSATGSARVGGGEFALRVLLTSGLVVTLTSGVHLLGPQLAGLLSAAPLVALVLTPATHHERGHAAVVVLLHGVAKGSVGAATFALVIALSVDALGGLAFLLATAAGSAAVTLVSMPGRPVVTSAPPVAAKTHSPAAGAQLVADPAQVLHE